MRSAIKAAVPLAVAVGLVAAGPAAADAKSPAKAHAAGGDVVELTYPTIVQSRLTRTRRALNRATDNIEDGQPVLAAAKLKVVRRQMAAAWRGAKYVIRTTPPPPAEEARVRRGARKAGDPATGPTYAQPPDTAFKVLSMHHRVAGEMVQLIDGAHGTGLDALSTTLYLTLDRRDQALQDILTLAPPVPPDDEEDPDEPEDPEDPADAGADAARVVARAAGDPVVSTFDTVMPNVAPQLDDEIQAIVGTETDATDLTVGGRRLLNLAEAQIGRTKTVVNTNWPPIPAED